MKKIFSNILYWIEINLFLLIGHIWAFIPIAFNDTSVSYNNFISSIPYILKGMSLLLIGSVLLGHSFRNKKDFNIYIYIVLQIIIIVLWVVYYSNNLIKEG